MDISRFSEIAQALGNEHRARIVEFLSCGELCACELNPYFGFSQPTLSSHMKVLRQSGVVLARQEGKMQMYSLNYPVLAAWQEFQQRLFHGGPDCICQNARGQATGRQAAQ